MQNNKQILVNGYSFKDDCKYFLSDRPCKYHKVEKNICPCIHYDQIKEKILIIKLNAVGDVLRTTCILPALAETYPHAYIYWLTEKSASALLLNNPYIDIILEKENFSLTFSTLLSEKFDLVINLDASKESSFLASIANAKKKLGFIISQNGNPYPTNDVAREWFFMGLNDDLKKENKKTYQEIVSGIIGVKFNNQKPLLNLYKNELNQAYDFLCSKSYYKNIPSVGFNTGAGRRWPLKQWTTQGFVEVINRLSENVESNLLILGGPDEVEKNKIIASEVSNSVIDCSCDRSIREFAALISHCDVLVTGDTLALHIGIALNKKVIALFGPTSYHEITLYGHGVKIKADMDCLCCYNEKCEIKPNCMDLIYPDLVYKTIIDLLNL